MYSSNFYRIKSGSILIYSAVTGTVNLYFSEILTKKKVEIRL